MTFKVFFILSSNQNDKQNNKNPELVKTSARGIDSINFDFYLLKSIAYDSPVGQNQLFRQFQLLILTLLVGLIYRI